MYIYVYIYIYICMYVSVCCLIFIDELIIWSYTKSTERSNFELIVYLITYYKKGKVCFRIGIRLYLN